VALPTPRTVRIIASVALSEKQNLFISMAVSEN
jgi:hypothetical protein